MEPEIIEIEEKILVGRRLRVTLAQDRTHELWSSFMPRRKEIGGRVSDELFSVEIFDEADNYKNFTPQKEFEKWAAVEVSQGAAVPEGMETLRIPAGCYAKFLYRGVASGAGKMFAYIFEKWMPGSGYAAEHRPHFEIMKEGYRPDDPGAEETFWIPVRKADAE